MDDESERKHWFDIMRSFLSFDDFLAFDVGALNIIEVITIYTLL